MKEINFMTIGDRNFFPIIHYALKKIIQIYPLSTVFIYDWGFTENQKIIIKSYKNIKLIDWREKLDKENGYKKVISDYEGYNPNKDIRKHEYMLMQKPYCMLDCSKKIKENLVFIDGDAILLNPVNEIFEGDNDIAVTLNAKIDIDKASKLGIKSPLNSGVLFFSSTSKKIQLFINEWINQMKFTKRIWIEQSSLSLLIEKHNPNIFEEYKLYGSIKINNINLRIRILPTQIYNFYKLEEGFDLNKTKIIHLKGRIPKIHRVIRDFKISSFLQKFIRIIPKVLIKRFNIYVIVKKMADLLYQPKKISYLRKGLSINIKNIRNLLLKSRIKN